MKYRHVSVVVVAVAVSLGSSVVNAQTFQPAAGAPGAWTLEQVITAALAQHPVVEAARARAAAARGSRRTAATFANPVGTYWLENSTFPGRGAIAGLSRETSAFVTMPLEPFFQRTPRTKRADEDVRAADADIAAAERRLSLDAARAFYRVALAQSSIEAARENHAVVNRLVEYLRSRVSQGASPEADLIRSEVERDQAESDLTLAEVDLLRAQTELRSLIGAAAPRGDFRVIGPNAPIGAARLPSLDQLAASATQSRPDLLATRARASAATAAVATERSLVIRQLGASFGLKQSNGATSMIAGVSISMPIFDRNRGEIARAIAGQSEAQQDVAWLERTITAEIAGTYEAATRLSGQLAKLQRSFLPRAEQSARLTAAAFEEGGATLLQALDATRALAAARLTWARVLSAERLTLFELAIAAGYEPANAVKLSAPIGDDR